MNTTLMVGMLAVISREVGIPLRFPGTPGHLKDACDAKLLARAIEWAGQSESAQNQIFNVANGDAFMWEQVFQKSPPCSEWNAIFPIPCPCRA